MSDSATKSTPQRDDLEAAVQANPSDPAARMRLAQFDARNWVQAPTAETLNTILSNIEAALSTLPAEHTGSVSAFLAELDRRGANLAAWGARFPRIKALVPVPPGAAAQGSPSQAFPSQSSASQAPRTPMPQAAKSPSGSTRTEVRTVDVGEVTNAKLKVWMDENKLEELASAFPLIDNVRTQRMVLDKLGATQTPLSAACLVRLLASVHDEAMNGEIRRKLMAFNPEMLSQELVYDPNDNKMKWAIVSVFSALETEKAVESLALALNDQVGSVRSAAIEGLAPKTEASPEWIDRLMTFVRKDQVPAVRMAAARALLVLGTKEAFDAFDAAALEPEFDKALAPVLEEFRGRFGGGRAARLKQAQKDAKAKRDAAAAKTSRFEARDLAKLAAGAVVLLLAVGFIVYTVKNYNTQLAGDFVPAPTIGPEEALRKRNEARERAQKAFYAAKQEQDAAAGK